MEKTVMLNVKVNTDVKETAELVLSQLGIPMATAIDIFLKQITLNGNIPFDLTLPKAPNNINVNMMSSSQIRDKLNEGLSDIECGKVSPARETFARFREERFNETL